MGYTDTLIVLGLALAAVALYRFARRALGPLKGVSIRFSSATRRTPGEVHRELWEQKGALDRAVKATAAARLAQSTPPRHAPDAPCEVEG